MLSFPLKRKHACVVLIESMLHVNLDVVLIKRKLLRPKVKQNMRNSNEPRKSRFVVLNYLHLVNHFRKCVRA